VADGALDLEKQPMGNEPSVNAPASGPYGEGAALQRLQDALPKAQPSPTAPSGPPMPSVSPEPAQPTSPQREGRPPSGAALPPGVPSPILAPTDRPDVPVSTPLASQSATPSLSAAQQRLQILDLLAESPGVSPTTQAWAQMVRRVIIGA
jgi:hypothetical protein